MSDARNTNSDAESEWEPRRTTQRPHTDDRFGVPLRGVDVGPKTRCGHYHGSRDIIAIRFPCCDAFYPCFACHKETTDHEPRRWPADRFHTPAVLCGACQAVLTIQQYLDADHACPSCGTAFNPNCARHYDRYFEVR